MPIIVRHEPDPRLLSQIGFQIGAGMQNQWQQEMAQRERMQARAIEANMLSQRIAQTQAWERQQAQIGGAMQRQLMGLQADQQMLQQRHDMNKELQQLEQDGRLDQAKFDWTLRRENALLGHTQGLEREAAKYAWDTVFGIQEHIQEMVGSGYQLSQEDTNSLNQLMKQTQELQQKAVEGDVMAAAQGAAALWSTYFPEFGAKQPTSQQQIDQATGRMMINGKEYPALVQPDGSVDIVEDPAEKAKGKEVKLYKTVDEVMADPDAMSKYSLVAVSALKDGTDPPSPEAVRKYVAGLLGEKESTDEEKLPEGSVVRFEIPE